jgi:hypothetical protein
MSKVCVVPDASSGVARSAMHTLSGTRSSFTRPFASFWARGGRGVRPYINCRDSHHMNESGREICS